MKITILSVIVLIMINSCNSETENKDSQENAQNELLINENNTTVITKILHNSEFRANAGRTDDYDHKIIEVIATQDRYEEIIQEENIQQDEIVDFDNGIIMSINMGLHGSNGYSIETVVKDNRIHIKYKRPGNHCSVGTIVTYPFQLLWIESRNNILISEEIIREDCEEK